MSGIFGCYDIKGNTSDVTKDTYYGAFSLQHRGQESAGIAVNDNGTLNQITINGGCVSPEKAAILLRVILAINNA